MNLLINNGDMILERYEWCDFWWEEADKQDKRRVLLIGDSIVKGYRPFVNTQLKDLAYVDMLATSKAADNPDLLKEIKYILDQDRYRYAVVVFNNGLHGVHLTSEEYETFFDNIIRAIANWATDASLLLALSTPVSMIGDTAMINNEITTIVSERNVVVRRLAKEHGLQIVNLYEYVYGKRQFRLDDGYHYNEVGNAALAELVSKVITKELTTTACYVTTITPPLTVEK